MSRRNTLALTLVAALALVMSAVGIGAYALVPQAKAATSGVTFSARGQALKTAAARSVDMKSVSGPSSAYSDPKTWKVAPSMPLLTGRSAATWNRLKQTRSNPNAPRPATGQANALAKPSTIATKTPYAGSGFKGLDNGCNPGLNGGYYFHPSDQALASSPNWVLEAVNNCIAVYDTSGALQSGFPKSPRTFFNVPMPAPSGCAGSFNQPFLTDPRAFYDPNDQRFVLAWLEVEGAFGVNTCTETSRIWVAVSKTNNPTGAWWVYNFNMLLSGTDAADYDQLGFDSQGVYLSANMFNQAGTAFTNAQVCAIPKANMETGAGLSYYCYNNLSATSTRTVMVDTVQPVLNESPSYGPRGEIFVNTWNMQGDPYGNDCASSACTGMVAWVFSNIANWANNSGTAPRLTGTFITNTKSYILPPAANIPSCTACVETLDTRISATPIYSHGFVWASWGTGVTNYNGQFVPGILWTQARVEMTDQDAACTKAGDICPDVSTSYQEQGYYFFYGSDIAAYFPAVMTDAESNLFMVLEYSSSTDPQSSVYVSRRATLKTGFFHDYGRWLQYGGSGSWGYGSRWGDYTAASYDGMSADHPWFCGQHAATNATTGYDWATWCTKVNYTLTYP